MKLDGTFKNTANIKGFEKILDGKDLTGFYRPDIVFKKDGRGKTISNLIIAESSSSCGKVHTAEIAQFIIFVSDNIENLSDYKFSFMLFLAGKKGSSTAVARAKMRVKHDFDILASDEVKEKIEGVYVVGQSDVIISKLTIRGLEKCKIWPK